MFNFNRRFIILKNKILRKKFEDELTQKIRTTGKFILAKRDALRQEYLEKDRKKLDTKEIEIELRLLNWIIDNE